MGQPEPSQLENWDDTSTQALSSLGQASPHCSNYGKLRSSYCTTLILLMNVYCVRTEAHLNFPNINRRVWSYEYVRLAQNLEPPEHPSSSTLVLTGYGIRRQGRLPSPPWMPEYFSISKLMLNFQPATPASHFTTKAAAHAGVAAEKRGLQLTPDRYDQEPG